MRPSGRVTRACLRGLVVGCLAAVVLASMPSRALAADRAAGAPASPKEQQAIALVKEGNAAYRVGQYARALSLYEKAHGLAPMPNTLFNMAQCHRKLGRPERALELYEQYLKGAPDAKNRATVERLMVELRVLVTPRPGTRRAAPAAGSSPAASGSSPAAGAAPAAAGASAAAPSPGTPGGVTAAAAPPPTARVLPKASSVAAARATAADATPAAATAPAREPAGRPRADNSRPFYRRWYFWVGLGLAAAGGAVAGALVGTRSADDVPDLGARAYFR